jgi:regulator of sirC expression with transglutaminase-like and TPR domain
MEKCFSWAQMAERIVSYEKEAALIQLLDDPSPVVQTALQEEFQRLGKAGLTILDRVIRGDSDDLKAHAEQIMGSISEPDPSRMLIEFIRGLQYELETGLFMINRVISPNLDIEPLQLGLDGLAQRCREISTAPMNPTEQCKLINRVLFHEAGFRGNTEDYDDPLNSCIEAVFRRRKGLPILLSSIYILLGQRLGLDLEPIGLPGHFLVGCFQGPEPFYIDPFERGRFRRVDELRELLAQHHISPEFHHLVPMPVGEVLCRVCRNLVLHFEARQQPRWANRFRTFVREFEETYRRRSEA